MANPMNQMLNRNPNSFNPLTAILEFKKFAAGISPQQAKSIIEQKLQSGEISQDQYISMQDKAKELLKFLK